VRLHLHFSPLLRAIACCCLLVSVIFSFSHAKQAPEKPAEKKPEKAALPEKSENPAQIELLETRYRFEANGDSRKEVHTRVHINNELGVRQFARLNFDYNRTFESIEIPLVHITHPSGGTADILPSAIIDNPNPAVVNAPAYQDVRIKSVRILGLEPGDTLEYRIITTTTHHPLAPDFWLDHSFDRSGIVSHEIFELDLPASPNIQVHVNPDTPANSTEKSGEGDARRTLYRWQRSATTAQETTSTDSAKKSDVKEPDVLVSTFGIWTMLSVRLSERLLPGPVPIEKVTSYEDLSRRPEITPAIGSKALEIAKSARTNTEKLEQVYDFVSEKIATVELPLGASGFLPRPAEEILASGYATQEDKFVLFAALSTALQLHASAALTGYCDSKALPRPSVFTHLLISASEGKNRFWLDPALEVAPFGMISPSPAKCALQLERSFYVMDSVGHEWQTVSTRLPFAAIQRVNVEAALGQDGKLTAKVHYSMRGDNELLLRVAFHQSPKDKWKELAQLLSISDGFRGQVTTVSASDPYATKEPFIVDYEITQPKFVDWSKKPVHIPALLPQLGLPDPPAPGAAASPVELGTPLEVETHMTLHLPPGTTIAPPTGTSVQRDYATFASQYSAKGLTVSASRHIDFLLRQIPAARAADYNAFLHAVQSDQAQFFTLDRESPPAPATKPAATALVPPPTPKP
jgi:uncharacterized protein DUF3857